MFLLLKNKITSIRDFPHITYDKTDYDGSIITIYVCQHGICNKTFTRSWNFLDHARTHKGIKPYKCHH